MKLVADFHPREVAFQVYRDVSNACQEAEDIRFEADLARLEALLRKALLTVRLARKEMALLEESSPREVRIRRREGVVVVRGAKTEIVCALTADRYWISPAGGVSVCEG